MRVHPFDEGLLLHRLTLILKLFKPPLQLVVVEGGLARESRAGPPDGAEAGAGAGPPAGAVGVRRAGAARRRGQGTGVVQSRGEGAGEAAGGALKLHDEIPERTVKDLDETSPQRHRGETQAEKFQSFSSE